MKWIQVIGFTATKEHRFRLILTAMRSLLGSAGCDALIPEEDCGINFSLQPVR